MSTSKEKILDAVLDTFLIIYILEYALLWIAYGSRTIKQKKFIFATLGTIYSVIIVLAAHLIDIDQKLQRILYGIAICLLSIRCLTSNFLLIFSHE